MFIVVDIKRHSCYTLIEMMGIIYRNCCFLYGLMKGGDTMGLKYKTSGNALKMAMLKQNIGIADLRMKANIAHLTAVKAVNGASISRVTCNKIAKALGVPVTELFICD